MLKDICGQLSAGGSAVSPVTVVVWFRSRFPPVTEEFFLLLPQDVGSPRHSCNKNQINETELRSCGVSSFNVVGAAVPAEPRSSSRTPPPEPLPRPGWRTRPCKTSSGSQFPFDLSPRTSLIRDSRTVADSPDTRPLAFRQKRSLRPLRGWKDSLVEERDHLTGSVVYYRMDGRRMLHSFYLQSTSGQSLRSS